jgi:hypothetical protein
LYWINVIGKQQTDTNTKSIFNLEEVKSVVKVVEDLLNL